MLYGRISAAAAAAVALVVMGAISIAGCGGGEETAEATVTKAQFVTQGDAICKRVLQQAAIKTEKLSKETGFEFPTATEQQLEKYIFDVTLPSLNQQTEGLAQLRGPAGSEEIIASYEDAAQRIEKEPSLDFAYEVLKEPGELARAYGFKVCGQN